MAVNRCKQMGARGGGGSRGGGGTVASMNAIRAQQKAVSSAQATLSKARKAYAGAQGSFYYTAQGEKAKAEAKVRLKKTHDAYWKANKNYYAQKAKLDKMVAKYQGKAAADAPF